MKNEEFKDLVETELVIEKAQCDCDSECCCEDGEYDHITPEEFAEWKKIIGEMSSEELKGLVLEKFWEMEIAPEEFDKVKKYGAEIWKSNTEDELMENSEKNYWCE